MRLFKVTAFIFRLVIIGILLCGPISIRAGMISSDGMNPWEICAMCHGLNGISAMDKFPILAGQKESYIQAQVISFRQGNRINDGGQMQAIVSEIRQEDIPVVANYFSSLPHEQQLENKDETGNRNPEYIRGKALFNRLDVTGVSCSSCHSDALSDAPWIDGQHRRYLEKQLFDFVSARRELLGNHETIVSMNDLDIEALAFYLSATSFKRR